MKESTVQASEFKTHCLRLIDEVADNGQPIVITKRGKPVAKLVRYPERTTHAHLIGALRGLLIVDENDDLLSTGAWVSDEWGDLNAKP